MQSNILDLDVILIYSLLDDIRNKNTDSIENYLSKEKLDSLKRSPNFSNKSFLKNMDILIKKNKTIYLLRDEPKYPNKYITNKLNDIYNTSQESTSIFFNKGYIFAFNIYLINSLDDIIKEKTSHLKYNISLIGLGDVGGTLLSGLRLLGKDLIESIKIYDIDQNKIERFYLEANEIYLSDDMPSVFKGSENSIYNSDIIIFTVSLSIPDINTNLKDVRLVQFDKNKKVLLEYAKKAEEKGFKGDYFIVSDPVDLLCMSLVFEGNIDSTRIRGFGLGVMDARARFIAKENNIYKKDLMSFGPHGNGLIIINSFEKYSPTESAFLTKQTIIDNFRVRKSGYKPFIAPALSSGSIQIIKSLKGENHLSSWFIGDAFFGSNNIYKDGFTKISKIELENQMEIFKESKKLIIKSYKG